MEEGRAYLENFWKPALYHSITTKEGVRGKIKYIEEPPYDNQVLLYEQDEVVYLQDCFWHPDEDSLYKMLKEFGAEIFDDGTIRFRKVFFGKPKNLEEYADTIRNIRFLGCMGGEEIINKYFFTNI